MCSATLSAVLTPAAGCDCGRCPFFCGNPRAVEPICSGCNSDCSWCGCARAGGGARCGQCPIRCGSRVDIAAWMTDVGGTLTFDDIALAQRLPAGLPRFIPQVESTAVAELDRGLGWSAYALGLRRVFSPATHTITPAFRDTTARQRLGLSEGQRAVLVGYGEDPLVEAFWTRRHQLIAALADQQWDLVLCPNFSMYGNYPRAEMLLNFRRNLLIAAEMCQAGLAAVPNLYWFRLEDLTRYERWLDDTRPQAVAVNLQTFRSEADWQSMALPGLTFLAGVLPDQTQMVVTGSSRPDRITTLVELYGERLRLVSQNAALYARHGAVMTLHGRHDLHAHVADAFAANVRFYARLLERPQGIHR